MTQWGIRIIEIINTNGITDFFVDQEMLFVDAFQRIAENKQTYTSMEFRYSLYRIRKEQSEVVATFTWTGKEELDLYQSIESRLDTAVKRKLYDKKMKKEVLKELQSSIPTSLKAAKGKASIPRTSYPPLPKLVEEGEPENEPIISKEATPRASLQKRKAKKNAPNFSLPFLVKKVSSKFPSKMKWKQVGNYLKPSKKGLLIGGFIVGSVVIASIFFQLITTMGQPDKVKEAPATYESLLKSKDYHKLATKYPEKFWQWEEKQVERSNKEQLVAIYEKYPNASIAFDLAFLNKSYEKVVQLVQDDPDKITLNPTRYAFLGFSYIQINKLVEAEATVSKTDSRALEGQLALAFLKKGNEKKATLYSEKSKDDAIIKQVKDYQLLHSTWDEVNKQLHKKKVSPKLKAKLKDNKRLLEKEMRKIKEGKEGHAE